MAHLLLGSKLSIEWRAKYQLLIKILGLLELKLQDLNYFENTLCFYLSRV